MRMRKIMMGLALLATISAGAQELTSGIDRNNMNLKVKPGNDFYEYAAGGWMKSHPLDAEHADNGAFTDLFELSQEQVRGLILGYADGKQPQGSLGQKIGSLYRLAMDSVRRNREGAKPIQPVLQRVAAVKNVAEYQRLAAELDRRGQASMLFGIGVGADLRDAKNNIVSIGQGGWDWAPATTTSTTTHRRSACARPTAPISSRCCVWLDTTRPRHRRRWKPLWPSRQDWPAWPTTR